MRCLVAVALLALATPAPGAADGGVVDGTDQPKPNEPPEPTLGGHSRAQAAAGCPQSHHAGGSCEGGGRPIFLVGKPEHWGAAMPTAHLKRACKNGHPVFLVGTGGTKAAAAANDAVPHVSHAGTLAFPMWASAAALDAFVAACMQHNDFSIEQRDHAKTKGVDHMRHCDVQLTYLATRMTQSGKKGLPAHEAVEGVPLTGSVAPHRVEAGFVKGGAWAGFGQSVVADMSYPTAQALCRALEVMEVGMLMDDSAILLDSAYTSSGSKILLGNLSYSRVGAS